MTWCDFLAFGATCAESRGRGSAFMRRASYDFHAINLSFLAVVVAGPETRPRSRGGRQPAHPQGRLWGVGAEVQGEERRHADYREVRARTQHVERGLSGAELNLCHIARFSSAASRELHAANGEPLF